MKLYLIKFRKKLKMVKLHELFEIVNIKKTNTLNNNLKSKLPYVSANEKNNGISDYIYNDSLKVYPKHTLSVSLNGSILETFYQERNYYASQDVGVLKPKINMSKEEMIYYTLCIKLHKKDIVMVKKHLELLKI